MAKNPADRPVTRSTLCNGTKTADNKSSLLDWGAEKIDNFETSMKQQALGIVIVTTKATFGLLVIVVDDDVVIVKMERRGCGSRQDLTC